LPARWLDHAISEIALGSTLSIDVAKKLPGESRSHRNWPPLIRMDEAVKAKVDPLLGGIC